MSLKNAPLFALVGMVLLTIVVGVGFVVSLAGFYAAWFLRFRSSHR